MPPKGAVFYGIGMAHDFGFANVGLPGGCSGEVGAMLVRVSVWK